MRSASACTRRPVRSGTRPPPNRDRASRARAMFKRGVLRHTHTRARRAHEREVDAVFVEDVVVLRLPRGLELVQHRLQFVRTHGRGAELRAHTRARDGWRRSHGGRGSNLGGAARRRTSRVTCGRSPSISSITCARAWITRGGAIARSTEGWRGRARLCTSSCLPTIADRGAPAPCAPRYGRSRSTVATRVRRRPQSG
eukprot:7380441-Prymnesium_polylepis.3